MKHTGCLHFITLMNLLHLPTSVNCPQDIISHIQVVHRLQVKSMHSLINYLREIWQEKLHLVALSYIIDEKAKGGFVYGTNYS